MKRKKLPSFISNPILIEIFQSRLGRVFTNWVLQGMLYMNPVEIFYKLVVDVVLTFLIAFYVIQDMSLTCIGLSLFIAHTINWIINGQPVALLMHIDIGSNNAEYFISYIEKLEKRIKTKKYLAACASYGSLSIGNYNPRSDIDIRIIMKDDMWSKIRAANFCFIERIRAFLAWFPLDLYAFTLEEIPRKMSPKEPPVTFYDPTGILVKTYDELIDFESFRSNFRDVVLPKQVKS